MMKILLVALFGVASTAYASDVKNPADCYTITYSEVPRTITPTKKRVHKRVHTGVPVKKRVHKKRKHIVRTTPIYQPHKTWYECPPPPQSVPKIPNGKPPILIPPGIWYYPAPPNIYIPPFYPLIPPEPIVPIFPAPPYYWFPYLPYYPPQYVPPVVPPTEPEIPFPVPPGYWPPNMPPPDFSPPKPPDNPYYPPVYVPPITTPPTDIIPPGSPSDTPPTDVPEPGTVALFGIALAALFLSRKRK